MLDIPYTSQMPPKYMGVHFRLEQPRKTAKIPQIFSDFYYE